MTSSPTAPSAETEMSLAQRKLALIAHLAATEEEAVIEAAEAAVREATDTAWMSDPYLLEQLRESEEDVKAGRVVPAEEVFAKIRAQLAAKRNAA